MSGLYNKARDLGLTSGILWTTAGKISLLLMKDTTSFAATVGAASTTVAGISGHILTNGDLGNPNGVLTGTVSSGVADFSQASTTVNGVDGGILEAILLYQYNEAGHAGSGNFPLVWLDTGTGGFGLNTNGNNVEIQWSASGVFKL